MDLHEVLREKFGYDSFRSGQEEVIRHILSGKDTIAIFPTGMGKSLCYQLPAYCMDGAVIIISPLVSLMEDQTANLRSHREKRVIAINSFLSKSEKELAIRSIGRFKFIFLSPEMLMQQEIQQMMQTLAIAFYVVDEAHCISEWGFDFRPDYLRLRELFSREGRPPILALTATANDTVVEDIISYLHLRQPHIERRPIDRPAISYQVLPLESQLEKNDWIINRLLTTKGPGIIYAASRSRADELAGMLRDRGIRVAGYHGGKEQDERSIIQEQFVQGDLDWICATNAFGMGIHKNDIRQIIHEHLPASPSAYVQEVGRAGRDGEKASATLLYSSRDVQKLSFIVYGDLPDEAQIRYYHSLVQSGISRTAAAEQAGLSEVAARLLEYYFERLDEQRVISQVGKIYREKERQIFEMESYVTHTGCLRRKLLSYFGEKPTGKDHCCSNCRNTDEDWLRKITPAQGRKQGLDWEERLMKLLG